MGERTSYSLEDGIATITLDDGKVNVLSNEMLAEINAALDQAAADEAVVILTGRPGLLSAGFYLPVLQGGGPDAAAMLASGFALAVRLLSAPRPVVIACPGHAIAMASFLLLSADYRIGAEGDYRIVANEVAIGMTLPKAAVELCRGRLAPAHFGRVTTLSEVYANEGAVAAGFLDRVVPADRLAETAREVATQLATLVPQAYVATKRLVRHDVLAAVHAALEEDSKGWVRG
jgi:enoyl-CoA hydratase